MFSGVQAAPQLMRLDISGAWLSAAGLAALQQLTRLDALSMDGTVQPADDTHYLAPLTRLTYLQVLRLLLTCSTRSAQHVQRLQFEPQCNPHPKSRSFFAASGTHICCAQNRPPDANASSDWRNGLPRSPSEC